MATKTKAKAETSAVPDAQESAAMPDIPAPESARNGFATEPHSPFADGYSIKGEEAALAEYIAAGADESDLLNYDRYIELEDRKDKLERMQAEFKDRQGAGSTVTRDEARRIVELGALVDEEVDQMTIHTKEAYRMFMGRTREPGKDAEPIIGGRRVASALRSLWLLTGNDNPYAEWALLRHEQTIKEIQRRLQRETQEAKDQIAELKAKGLHYSILKSDEPQVLNLGYRSPYGYAVSALIVEFDYFVRLEKTLARKTLRSDEQTRKVITELTRFIRRVFNETTRFDRWLTHDEVRSMSRNDFLPEADAEARKRVEFASGVFGMVPSEVFTGKLHPRHSRRRMQMTPAERQLLQSVGARLDAVDEQQEPAAPDGQEQDADAKLV